MCQEASDAEDFEIKPTAEREGIFLEDTACFYVSEINLADAEGIFHEWNLT